MIARFFAELFMLAHAAFAVFILFGLAWLIIGVAFPQFEIRHLRRIHLVATLLLVARVCLGIPCPLSQVEDLFRHQCNGMPDSPIHEFFHHLAFRGNDPRQFAASVIAIGALTLGLFVMVESGLSPVRPNQPCPGFHRLTKSRE